MVLVRICFYITFIFLLVSAQRNVQFGRMAFHQDYPFVDPYERIVIVDPDPENYLRHEANSNINNHQVPEVSENLRLFKKRNHGRIRMI